MDDDTLPVIDLTDEADDTNEIDAADADEVGEAASASGERALPAPPARARRRRRWAGPAALVAAVAVLAGSGGVVWSSTGRKAAVAAVPRAGDYADRLRCLDGDPRVRNDLGLWDDVVSLPGDRRLPLPPWLRDRSLGATKIRTALDAARWSNANTDAAVAFGTVSLAAWDMATRVELERAEDWMRAWWSRHRNVVPPTWTEASAVAAVRAAVLDDRLIVERTARSFRRSLGWRVLPVPPGQDRAGTAVVGGTVRGEGRLAEVLVYRRSADGYLRLRGHAYCDEVDDIPSDDVATRSGGELAQSPEAPALACAPRPPQPQPESRLVTETVALSAIAMEPPSRSHSAPEPTPDGHVLPRVFPPPPSPRLHGAPDGAVGDEPAMRAEDALERFGTARGRPSGTIGAGLSYELVSADDSRGYGAGRYQGQVKLVVELRRQLGGRWTVVSHAGCAHELAQPA